MADIENINNEEIIEGSEEIKPLSDGGTIVSVVEVEPFKADVEIKVEDWNRVGTVYEAVVSVPGLCKDGITKAFIDEEKMKEVNLSWAIKLFDQIFGDDYLEIKSLDNCIVASFIDTKKPPISIFLNIEQLPFN